MFCLELGVLDYLEELELILCQIWMPEVNNQDQSGFFSIMPSLMLKTIIKDIRFTSNLVSGFLVDSQSTVVDAHQRKMKPEFLIRWTIMFHDVGLGCQCTEKCMMVVVGNVFIDE